MGVRQRLEQIGVKKLFIEPGSPWENGENGYNESFNGKLRDDLLNMERVDVSDDLDESAEKVSTDKPDQEVRHVRRPHGLSHAEKVSACEPDQKRNRYPH